MPMHFTITKTLVRVLAFAALIAWPAGLQGQVLRGRVVEASSDDPVPHAAVELIDEGGRVAASVYVDSSGAFALRGWREGRYQLRVFAAGYQSITSEVLVLGADERLELTIRVDRDAVALEPIVVEARARLSLPEHVLREYIDRRERGRRWGFGRFLEEDDLAQRGRTLTDVLRTIPGVRIRHAAGCRFPVVTLGSVPSRLEGDAAGCSQDTICPVRFYVDGAPLTLAGTVEMSIDEIVSKDWVTAIEVYRRPHEIPAEFRAESSCGVIAIWTRR